MRIWYATSCLILISIAFLTPLDIVAWTRMIGSARVDNNFETLGTNRWKVSLNFSEISDASLPAVQLVAPDIYEPRRLTHHDWAVHAYSRAQAFFPGRTFTSEETSWDIVPERLGQMGDTTYSFACTYASSFRMRSSFNSSKALSSSY